MAEQKSYMQQLDDWTNSHVIAPLIRVYDSEEAQGLSSEEAERRQSEVFAQVALSVLPLFTAPAPVRDDADDGDVAPAHRSGQFSKTFFASCQAPTYRVGSFRYLSFLPPRAG